MLSRDGSIFEKMFSSDMQGSGAYGFQQEGSSDETPIRLQGDKLEEFRDLLWSLYALPQEIAISMSPQADILKVVNTLRMAHKYHFVTTESWATTTIVKYLQYQLPAPLPTETLVKISGAAVLCGDDVLLDVVRQKWRSLIGEERDLALALTTLEQLGLRDLQGLAYQAMLLKGRDTWERETLLTRDQRIRLLSGYHNITTFLTNLANEPPHFDHIDECEELFQCKDYWEGLWRDMNDFQSADERSRPRHLIPNFTTNKLDLVSRSMMLVSILQAMNDQPEMFGTRDLPEFPCMSAALKATIAFSRRLQMEMMDFFEDVK